MHTVSRRVRLGQVQESRRDPVFILTAGLKSPPPNSVSGRQETAPGLDGRGAARENVRLATGEPWIG